MTAEQRTVIAPADIIAIELECTECGCRVRHLLNKIELGSLGLAVKCPNCRREIIESGEKGPEPGKLVAFIEALKRLPTYRGPGIVRLEISSGPGAPSPS
jgi:hypothetical protein